MSALNICVAHGDWPASECQSDPEHLKSSMKSSRNCCWEAAALRSSMFQRRDDRSVGYEAGSSPEVSLLLDSDSESDWNGSEVIGCHMLNVRHRGYLSESTAEYFMGQYGTWYYSV